MDWHVVELLCVPISALIGYAAKGWFGQQLRAAQVDERAHVRQEFSAEIQLRLAEFENSFMTRLNGTYLRKETYGPQIATLQSEVERLRDRVEEIQ